MFINMSQEKVVKKFNLTYNYIEVERKISPIHPRHMDHKVHNALI